MWCLVIPMRDDPRDVRRCVVAGGGVRAGVLVLLRRSDYQICLLGLADEEEVRSVWLQADETLGHGLLRLLRDGACDEQPARDSLPRLFPDARWAGLGFGGVLRSHESLCPQSRWHLQRRPVCSICLPRPDLGTVHCLVWRGMFPLRLRMCIERLPVVPRPDGARHVLALRADGRGYQ